MRQDVVQGGVAGFGDLSGVLGGGSDPGEGQGRPGSNSSSQRDSSCAGKRWKWGQLQFTFSAPTAQAKEGVCHSLDTDPVPGA